MLQANCAPITSPRFDAPTISSDFVSESINVPDAIIPEDPAVTAWRAWRAAQLAFEAGEATLDDDVALAETALCLTQPTTLAGALAQLRCALTFIGDFDGWVRNLALDQAAPDDTAARAKDMAATQMVARVIDFLAATLSGRSVERPCTEGDKPREVAGGWSDRVAEWKLRLALRKATEHFGPHYHAGDKFERSRKRLIDQYGSLDRVKVDSVDGEIWRGIWDTMEVAENKYVSDYLVPADKAAAALVEYPASSLEDILLKIEVIAEHDLHEGSLLSKDAMAIIFDDCARLGIEVPR